MTTARINSLTNEELKREITTWEAIQIAFGMQIQKNPYTDWTNFNLYRNTVKEMKATLAGRN